MALFQIRERSRRGVSKNSRRLTALGSVPKVKTEPEPEPLSAEVLAILAEPDDEWWFENSLAELVDPILALQKKIRAEHPEIAAELMRIAHITDYALTITENP